ncbi:MAG: hypothetical protein ACXACX_04025, partial [Candidatus Hodarchaeales archaeon]
MIDPPEIRIPKNNRRKKVRSPAPKIIRGLIFFTNKSRWDREDAVIRRINSFLPNDSHLTYTPEKLLSHGWSMYRKLALKAINEYIKSFPFLAHTPATLRAAFGVPTRKDRQRGKYSGISLISQALGWENPSHNNRDQIPTLPKGDLETVNELKNVLEITIKNNILSEDLLNYINYQVDKNPLKEIIIPEINTHSDESLEKVKKNLEEYGFKDLNYDIQQDEDHILTPDLIGNYNNELVWVELKEWDPETNKKLFLKPLKQIFQYSLQAKIVVIICSEKLEFIKFIRKNKEWFISDLQKEINDELQEFNQKKENIDILRSNYIKIGEKLLKKGLLSAKTEALLATIISAKTHEELGVINTEVD